MNITGLSIIHACMTLIIPHHFYFYKKKIHLVNLQIIFFNALYQSLLS